MAERPPKPVQHRPVLQKPPGYRDPNAPPPRPPTSAPRRQTLPPAFRQHPPHRKQSRRCTCRFCCCLVFLTVLSLLSLIAVAGALSYLWFQPRLPSFHLQSLRPLRLNVSSRADGTFVSSATVIRVQAYNPNSKIGFLYGRSTASVSANGDDDDDDDVEMGTGTVEGFEQGRKNATVMKFSVKVREVAVDDDVGVRIRRRFKSGEIRYSVEVRTRVGLRVNGRRTGDVPVRVICERVSLRRMNKGEIPKCKINTLKW
ncbi:hypothetical protein QJS10_CPA03g00229 [Acorus calamus]|uniref:Late embryogenesis abundant protein LEA-2 subgroup domain-containing protein n=1 Tax=Acorus calamus TaxID=4465 RepID=A0AAV9F7E2_ACOCL|nr:hypothetical protein QJS10_CPA03g00229 [Acorus calamus]